MKSVLAALALAAAALLATAPASAETVRKTYPESAADFQNPERGFWRFVAEDFAAVTPGELADVRQSGMTMAYGVVRLDRFRGKALTPGLLRSLERSFQRARASGVKIILRFAYNYPQDEHEYQNAKDAKLSVVLGHIAQLKPVLAANADMIAVLQAGFIGAWGEGHTSSNRLDTPANKATIRDALLDALPDGRMLQWRYPGDLIDWSADAPPAGSLAKIGLHNDCFMSSDTDVGTYDERPAIRERQRDYVAKLSRATMFGGETCAAEPRGARLGCAAILAEGPQFHLTTLNRDYYARFTKSWTDEGCMPEVTRSMGYRLVLTEAEAPRRASPGATATVSIKLRNAGWARLYNPRALVLTAVQRASGRRFAVTAPGDVRDVEPETAAPTAFTFDWAVPVDAPAGVYDLEAALPDASPSLADDSRFAVRFANDDGAGFGWANARGAYRLGLRINVAE